MQVMEILSQIPGLLQQAGGGRLALSYTSLGDLGEVQRAELEAEARGVLRLLHSDDYLKFMKVSKMKQHCVLAMFGRCGLRKE